MPPAVLAASAAYNPDVRIYTKTGDGGTTGLVGGARISKSEALVEAYGTVDETNAVLGLVRASEPPADVDCILRVVQSDLFRVGAELACQADRLDTLQGTLITSAEIKKLEEWLDELTERLPEPSGFVLPGGCRAAATLHLARTVCRRAERRVVAIHRVAALRSEPLVYLNRLSDLFYLLAQRCNQAAGRDEEPWRRKP